MKHEYNTYKYYTRVSLYLQFVNISYEYYGRLVGGDERSKIRMKYYVRTSVVYILIMELFKIIKYVHKRSVLVISHILLKEACLIEEKNIGYNFVGNNNTT